MAVQLYIRGVDEKNVQEYLLSCTPLADAHRRSLTTCVEKSMNSLPQLEYLNDIVKSSISLPNNITNTIINYFYKCCSRENYFDFKYITCCDCIINGTKKLVWCVYCAEIKLYNKYCFSCVPTNYDFADSSKLLKCIIKNCKQYVYFGNMCNSLYCAIHSISSLLVVNNQCVHIGCTNKGSFVTWEGFHCYLHKPDVCNIAFI